jgi:hypothetical protein
MKKPEWVNWHSFISILMMITASLGFFVFLAADRSLFSKSEPE